MADELKPQPRVGEDGVSWCDDRCPLLTHEGRPTYRKRMSICSVTKRVHMAPTPCVPTIRAEREELVQLRAASRDASQRNYFDTRADAAVRAREQEIEGRIEALLAIYEPRSPQANILITMRDFVRGDGR